MGADGGNARFDHDNVVQPKAFLRAFGRVAQRRTSCSQ